MEEKRGIKKSLTTEIKGDIRKNERQGKKECQEEGKEKEYSK